MHHDQLCLQQNVNVEVAVRYTPQLRIHCPLTDSS